MARARRETNSLSVAPPRGERGLKLLARLTRLCHVRRSPSWGAWIEIKAGKRFAYHGRVAPPRGERGLKLTPFGALAPCFIVAPPCGERGLKSARATARSGLRGVAPPCGERGLKCD